MTELGAASWAGLPTGELARRWKVPLVHAFRRVGSTNDVARRLAATGAASGTVVVADEQVAGRGRMGRAWASPPGLGLWVSLVERPEPARLAILPLLVGLAVAEALDALLPPPGVAIKWPNDLEVDGRKLGGILCEASWEGERPGAVVVGLGLNVLHDASHFPAELRERATSLGMVAGRALDRAAVADRVVPAVRRAAAGTLGADPLARLCDRDALRGRAVTVSEPASGATLAAGTACGVAADGSLLVQVAPDRVRCFRSGTVRLAGQTP